MTDSQEVNTPAPNNWHARAYAIGGLVGALAGLGAAYMFVRAARKRATGPELPPSEVVAIGLALLALLRQIATLYEQDDSSKK